MRKPVIKDIRHGEVILESAPYVIHQSRGCIVYEIDCYTKRPAVYLSFGDDDAEVMMVTQAETLYANADKEGTPTTIYLDKTQGYSMSVEGSKYSFRVICYKPRDGRTFLARLVYWLNQRRGG